MPRHRLPDIGFAGSASGQRSRRTGRGRPCVACLGSTIGTTTTLHRVAVLTYRRSRRNRQAGARASPGGNSACTPAWRSISASISTRSASGRRPQISEITVTGSSGSRCRFLRRISTAFGRPSLCEPASHARDVEVKRQPQHNERRRHRQRPSHRAAKCTAQPASQNTAVGPPGNAAGRERLGDTTGDIGQPRTEPDP